MENYLKIKNENCVQKGTVCRCINESEFCEHQDDHCGDCTAYEMATLHMYERKPRNGQADYDCTFNKTLRSYYLEIEAPVEADDLGYFPDEV